MGGLVSGYRPLGSDEIKTNFSEGGSLLRSQRNKLLGSRTELEGGHWSKV